MCLAHQTPAITLNVAAINTSSSSAHVCCLVLLQGFGLEGLGIVTISGVPNYPDLRKQLLPLAQAFAVSAAWC